MATVGSLVVDLKARTAQFERSIQKASKRVGTLTKAVSAVAVAMAARRFASSAIKAAQRQEAAEAKLERALQNVAGASAEGAKQLEAYAASLQKVTAFGDEEIINAQAMLATFQLNEEAIKKLTPRVLDMATSIDELTGTHASLQSVAITVGKALTGTAGQLSRYGVVMTKAQQEQLRLATGMDKVNLIAEILDQNFKGLAQAIGITALGETRKLANAWGDLKETLGDSEAIVQATRALRGIVEKLDEATKKVKGLGYDYGYYLNPLLEKLGLTYRFITPAQKEFLDNVKKEQRALSGGLPVQSEFIEKLEKMAEKTKGLEGDYLIMARGFDDAQAKALNFARGLDLLGDDLETTEDKTQQVAEAVLKLAAAFRKVDEQKARIEGFNRTVEEIESRIEDARLQVKAFTDAAVSGFEQMIFGADSFRDSLRNVLREMARLVLQKAILEPASSGLSGFITNIFARRQHGGPVAAGRPYQVGERGPEVFVPRTSGTIVPNQSLGGVTVVYNIDARGADAGVEGRIERALRRTKAEAIQEAVQKVGTIRRRGGSPARSLTGG